MKTLYLIDGYAQFFRAYHAIRTPMTSPVTKEPTNLTFGFVGMLLKLLREEGKIAEHGSHADYIALALDVSGDRGTFRSQIYPEYKATRPPPPDDLFPQVQRCLSLLESIGLPVIGAEGYEADDVIATLATKLTEADPDLRIRIISKDKDLKQLLGDRVEMYDIHKDELFSRETLRETLAIEPSQMIDLLSLMGDTSDNIPGVEGVGEKTAAKLIAEHGSLDALLAVADTIQGKRGEKLREAADRLDLSRQLVTLHKDLDLDFELASAARDKLNLESLLPIMRELGFGRYQDEVKKLMGTEGDAGDQAAAPRPPIQTGVIGGLFDQPTSPRVIETTGDYRTITTREQLDALAQELRDAETVCFDTETTSLCPVDAELCGLSFSTKPGVAVYIPIRTPTPEAHLDEKTVLEVLGPILENPEVPKIAHNLKYDLLVLRRAGITLRGHEYERADDTSMRGDTMVASFLIDALRSSHGMDSLALALLDHTTISIRDLIGKGKDQRTFDQVPLELASPYAAEDADITLQLAGKLFPLIEPMGLNRLWREIELPLVEVLASLEWNGILVEPGELRAQEVRLQVKIEELRKRIREIAIEEAGRAFDPDSPRQLAGILFNKPDHDEPGLGLRPLKRGKTGPSTDAEVLEKLSLDPGIETRLPDLMLEYRQLTKLVNTYLGNLRECINPRTKRIHASFHQTGAATGRLSSSDPNLQNIPIRSDIGREIRKAFIAPPGRVLITADYSQIELRLLAHLSRDPALIEAFEAGEDIHKAVAARIHRVPVNEVTSSQRSGAKMVNFGIVYGITPYGLARRLNMSNAEATEIIRDYKHRFKGIASFLQECMDFAHKHGYVQTMLGRRRPIADLDSNIPTRQANAERVAINSVVQGSAADLIKIAMVDIHKRLGWRERTDEVPWSERGPASEGHASQAQGHEATKPRRETGGMGVPPVLAEVQAPDPALRGVLMLLQIHDELVFEAPADTAEDARSLIVERMEAAMDLRVPLIVDSHIATTWYEGK